MALQSGLFRYLKALLGAHEDSSLTLGSELRRLARRAVVLEKAVDAAAGDETAASVFYRCATNQRVVSCYYLPRGTAAAHGSNIATVKLVSGDGTGTPATLVASEHTTTTTGTAMADGVPWLLIDTVAAELELTAGDVLALAITKGASGVVVPAGSLCVELEDM